MSASARHARNPKAPLTFPRGVHPHDWKELSANAAIEVVPTPESVTIPLLQHIGSPNELIVKPRQQVALGEKIAESKAFVSAPVHSPVAGVIGAAGMVSLPNARHVPCVSIEAKGPQLEGRALWDEVFGGDWPTNGAAGGSGERILQAIREGGLVGMGGAGFPTHVKLAPNAEKPVDTLLVNGCECEPYLTGDYRLMIEAPGPIIAGALLAAKAGGAERIVLAIEDNKPDAIWAMRAAAEGKGIEVVAVAAKYPMGGERQLVVAAVGRVVPTGGLPLDCGVVVINVGTAAAVARAVLRGKPLTHRVITVSGQGVNRPCNLLCPIGASYRQLINVAGGLTDQAVRVVAGGPMMGFAVNDLDEPVTKGAGGITVLTRRDVGAPEETPCIRCGRCVDVCPLRLTPTRIALAARNKDWDLARRYYMAACVECGCCAYACPARIPLVQIIRAGKATMPR
jgi:Na+-translocating ferredoxin:NAD+ oxidoreductase subunit C